ncbi:MAG: hypothetical protein K1X78_19025 [Verrucomicrobiaceae bacterium]|nr:hypothetical protein [Verrucomicrobiaceae bacterium]
MDLTTSQNEWIQAHLEEVRLKIVKRAQEIGEDSVTVEDVAVAIADVCPIKHRANSRAGVMRTSILLSFFSSLPAIAWVSAALAVAFGVLGVFGKGFGNLSPTETQGWLDIAKIFAGAVVGASGTAVARKCE